jgi:hypothetical protein
MEVSISAWQGGKATKPNPQDTRQEMLGTGVSQAAGRRCPARPQGKQLLPRQQDRHVPIECGTLSQQRPFGFG